MERTQSEDNISENYQPSQGGATSNGTNNTKLWKQFGRESDVGKMLFSMYSAGEKPKVYYPPVKTKPRVEPPKEEKKCP